MKKKIMLTLAILVLVFGVAACLKTQAGTGENGAGWLWGGGEELDGVALWDGTNTNVRWLSLNNTNTSGAISYGVNIPASGIVTGYAWSGGDDSGPGLGYIDFEPQTNCTTGAPGATQYQAVSCIPPSGSAGVTRTGDYLTGWARIVEIAKATVTGNSGGWTGWIHMDGTNYGVSINTDGTFCKAGDPKTIDLNGDGQRHCFASAGDDELGWIDFSRASIQACVVDPNLSKYSCKNGTCGACESASTTAYWICIKTDNCENTTTVPQADCINNDIDTCSDTTCPACPTTSNNANWKEVAP